MHCFCKSSLCVCRRSTNDYDFKRKSIQSDRSAVYVYLPGIGF